MISAEKLFIFKKCDETAKSRENNLSFDDQIIQERTYKAPV